MGYHSSDRIQRVVVHIRIEVAVEEMDSGRTERDETNIRFGAPSQYGVIPGASTLTLNREQWGIMIDLQQIDRSHHSFSKKVQVPKNYKSTVVSSNDLQVGLLLHRC